jgi:hypothetical protein
VTRVYALIPVLLVLLAALQSSPVSASGGGWGSASYRVRAVLEVSGVYNGSAVDGRVVCRGVVGASIVNISKTYDLVEIRVYEVKPLECNWRGSLGPLEPEKLVNLTRRNVLDLFIQGHYNKTSGIAVAHYYSGRPGNLFVAPEVLALAGYRFEGSIEAVEPIQNYTTGTLGGVALFSKGYMASYDKGIGFLKYYKCKCLWERVNVTGERLTYKLTITASTGAKTELVETLHYSLTPPLEGLAGAVAALAVLAAVAFKRCSCKSEESARQPAPVAG